MNADDLIYVAAKSRIFDIYVKTKIVNIKSHYLKGTVVILPSSSSAV